MLPLLPDLIRAFCAAGALAGLAAVAGVLFHRPDLTMAADAVGVVLGMSAVHVWHELRP